MKWIYHADRMWRGIDSKKMTKHEQLEQGITIEGTNH